jgi:hypothetical protein
MGGNSLMSLEKRVEALEKALGVERPKVTNILFILDSSGSMMCVKDQTEKNFIEQVNTLRGKAHLMGETTFSLIKFGATPDSMKPHFRDNDAVMLDIQACPIEKMQPLEGYMPTGMTPMYDAIGYGLEILQELEKAQEGKDVANLIVIFTDGQENASWHYHASQIAEKVKALKATGRYTMQLMGANINLEDAKAIFLGDCYTSYDNTARGVMLMNSALTGSLETYAANRSRNIVTTSLNVPNTSGTTS